MPPKWKDDYTFYRARAVVPIAAGLAGALLMVLLFGWLGCEMLAGDTQALDMAVREAVHRHASAPLTYFFRAVTMLGSTAVLVPAGMVLLARWVRVRRRAAVLFAITMAGAVLLDITLKEVFHRPRPQPFFELAKPRTASFPSGHALVSFCFWGAAAALSGRRVRPAVWAGVAVLVLLIGLSRIYLGVHYPSDVIAGYLAAVAWVLAVRSAYRMIAGVRRA